MIWSKSRISRKVSGKVSIADADIVVSAGRGFNGNWGMIEELTVLGAATCSKPVSDLDGDLMEHWSNRRNR
jgi:electron transfer flavoprotein alpha subunit